MIKSKYKNEYSKEEVQLYIERFKNRVFKGLCLREEEVEWDKFFITLIQEFDGFHRLFNQPARSIEILSKMESALKEEEFQTFRKTIFEILHCLDDFVEQGDEESDGSLQCEIK